MKGDFSLKTDRFLMRPLNIDDVDVIWPHISNPDISKYMSWDAHKNKPETKKFLARIQNEKEKGKTIIWGIFSENKFVGLISLIAIIRNHRSLIYDKAELAYWLAPSFQKTGIMTEVGEKIIDFAFNVLGFHRLTVSHVSQNIASEKLIKKWKFRYIGEEREAFKKDGKWFNHKLYELLDKDYKSFH